MPESPVRRQRAGCAGLWDSSGDELDGLAAGSEVAAGLLQKAVAVDSEAGRGIGEQAPDGLLRGS